MKEKTSLRSNLRKNAQLTQADQVPSPIFVFFIFPAAIDPLMSCLMLLNLQTARPSSSHVDP